MNSTAQKNENAATDLHHVEGRKESSGQFLYMKNPDHEKSSGMKWVKTAFSKATLGAVRALTRSQ